MCLLAQLAEIVGLGDLGDLLSFLHLVYFDLQLVDLLFQGAFTLAHLDGVVNGDRRLSRQPALSWPIILFKLIGFMMHERERPDQS